MDKNIYDAIVVGSGPAGMSVALNMLRYGKTVLILEKDHIGGQAANASKIENLPSLGSISGIEFSNNFFKQLLSFNVLFKLEEVLRVKKNNDNIFEIDTNLDKYMSRTVIVATGVKERKIKIDDEKKFLGHGISYCATCDGIFFKNKDVCVFGDGDTALQYALSLSNYCKDIFICTPTEKVFADEILIKKIKEKQNIFIKNSLLIKKVFGDEKSNFLTKIEFLNLKNKLTEFLSVNGLFIAIGQEPNNSILNELVKLEKGFIVVNEKMETKTPGLFAVGDCIVKNVRQISTAVGDGSIAAFFANKYINISK